MLARTIRVIENVISFVCLGTIVLCVLWGVFSRHISETPAAWSAELAGILFTWVVFIGAATAFREGRHIRIDLLFDLIPPRAGQALRLVANLAVVAFLATATVLSLQMMQQGATRVSPVLRLPFSWVYLATVLGFGLMTVTAALRLLGLAPEPAPVQPEDTL